jgi:hypothetical protein
MPDRKLVCRAGLAEPAIAFNVLFLLGILSLAGCD